MKLRQMSSFSKLTALCLTTIIACISTVFLTKQNNLLCYISYEKEIDVSHLGDVMYLNKILSLLMGTYNCDVLGQTKDVFVYPAIYLSERSSLDNKLKALTKSQYLEGHSGGYSQQTITYLALVNKTSFIKTVCETGFNAGHSTLAWLAGNRNTHVYSFDLGEHAYSRPMAAHLQANFPGRLNVTWGDSKVTIPAFIKKNPWLTCNLIVVDGGHGYVEAKADLRNFRNYADKHNHLLIVDDLPARYLQGIQLAWREEIMGQHIRELFKCQSSSIQTRGFTFGQYIGIGNSSST